MKKYYQIADNIVLRAHPRSSCESCCDDINNIILFDYQEEPFEDDNYDPMYCFGCFCNSYEYKNMINIRYETIREFLKEYCKITGDKEILSKLNDSIKTNTNKKLMKVFEEVGWKSTQDDSIDEDDFYDEDEE